MDGIVLGLSAYNNFFRINAMPLIIILVTMMNSIDRGVGPNPSIQVASTFGGFIFAAANFSHKNNSIGYEVRFMVVTSKGKMAAIWK